MDDIAHEAGQADDGADDHGGDRALNHREPGGADHRDQRDAPHVEALATGVIGAVGEQLPGQHCCNERDGYVEEENTPPVDHRNHHRCDGWSGDAHHAPDDRVGGEDPRSAVGCIGEADDRHGHGEEKAGGDALQRSSPDETGHRRRHATRQGGEDERHDRPAEYPAGSDAVNEWTRSEDCHP